MRKNDVIGKTKRVDKVKVKVLIVDDSTLMRRILTDVVNANPQFEVDRTAVNGKEALQILLENPTYYDIVLLDIYMPFMTGLELLKELQQHPEVRAKIIICSTKADESAEETFTALEYGAFDFIKKPDNLIGARNHTFHNELINLLCAAVENKNKEITKKLVQQQRPVKRAEAKQIPVAPVAEIQAPKGSGTKIIALACSTGGPKTLQSVIPLLPKELDAGMVLVQHMPKGFTRTLSARLDAMSKVRVKEAQDGDIVEKGCVYIAPGGFQMKLQQIPGDKYKIMITDEPPRDSLKPCANIMYESLVKTKVDEIVCVVLTEMGADGTEGIGALKKSNKIYVIAQDEETSVVYGMPKAVAKAGLTDEIVPMQEIANTIIKKVGVQ